MIFLSAQPDAPYFIWQLEVQITNFLSFNIKADQIHILIGYNEVDGINYQFLEFSKRYSDKANFFFYPDKRVRKKYMSSIRPHIINQHYIKYDNLCKEALFYHDSDIVFTHKLPNFDRLCLGDTWYFSDARSYLDSKFIKAKDSIAFAEMCEVIKIDPKLVQDNDVNAGGAQTLLKNVTASFWAQIEEDCENLYAFLQKRFTAIRKQNNVNQLASQVQPVSPWCSDMWALLWNSLKIAKVNVDSELDFCWPHYPSSSWYKCNIFHNAGVEEPQRNEMFYKADFYEKSPYFYSFSSMDKQNCSFMYVDKLKTIKSSLYYDLSDVTFIIPIRIDSEDRIDNLNTTIRYIRKYFKTNIIVMEGDANRKVFLDEDDSNLKYLFNLDPEPIFLRQVYNNRMVNIATSPYIIKYDCDVIVPPDQIYNSVLALRHKACKFCYPYNGNFVRIHGVLRKEFIKELDPELLFRYTSLVEDPAESYGGCIVVDREEFIRIGMDNCKFNGWGFEDQELNKRIKILGYHCLRIDGPLFHLEHYRGTHSNFYDAEETVNSYSEFVKVSNMREIELKAYIQEW